MSRDLKSYAYCFVPGCKNTNKSTPGKFFFCVPNNESRKLWCSAVGRDPDSLSLKSPRRCCEDHFKFEEDVANWPYYKALLDANYPMPGIRLKKDALPRKDVPQKPASILICPEEDSGEEETGSISESEQGHEEEDPLAICQIPAHSILRCPDEDAGGEVVISNSSVSLEHIENDDPSIFCQVQISENEDYEYDLEMNEVQKQLAFKGNRWKRSVGAQKNVSAVNEETETCAIIDRTRTRTVSPSHPKRQRIKVNLPS
ncbi:unnamed protein product [Bemisia tabaci]|uniref:THAP-type domain-containing protein n=1 Tax=Bemisia tabaci TaxID=7038 RepID=A0A9P0A557_BEMTA|nr:unnamed protein product [Bemisia tabaci]